MNENNEQAISLTTSTIADEEQQHEQQPKIPESPKPLAFTVDFGDGKTVDSQRHKNLVEKLQKKHRRGQSLSKLDDVPSAAATPSPIASAVKRHPLTGNLPRKSSFQSEGYFSSDEKSDRSSAKSMVQRAGATKRSELSLPLKNVASDKIMTQSFPSSAALFSRTTPEVELKDVSSPELDMISPFSPRPVIQRQFSSPETASMLNNLQHEQFVDGTEFDFDKSDTASDTGTYTLDADNYSEEQKERMSIDREFKIEQISVAKKTAEYVKSLSQFRPDKQATLTTTTTVPKSIQKQIEEMKLKSSAEDKVTSTPTKQSNKFKSFTSNAKMLSPILSPTQNLSITGSAAVEKCANNNESKTFTKIMFPSPKAKANGLEQLVDQGSIISVTSSGAFKSKNEKENLHIRRLSLTKSEIQVEAYVGDKVIPPTTAVVSVSSPLCNSRRKLTANIVNVQNISNATSDTTNDEIICGNLALGKISNLPPQVGSGKMSPSKIPSPIHTLSRPRSRNSANLDLLSDSSLETESYLKPTQNCINSLEQRLSLDDDEDGSEHEESSDYDRTYLNNSTPHNLQKKQATHIRHNSLDDKISNKLEHFQNKNLLNNSTTSGGASNGSNIDQTFNLFNQYNNGKMHKIQNSPNNSPIRRSSSFSTNKNQIFLPTKNTNLQQETTNFRNSPSLGGRLSSANSAIQRSASTANIKPNLIQQQQRKMLAEQQQQHGRIDRNQFGDTESSSEDDFEKNMAKKKDLSNLTSTRYNRAFSLRRARLDEPQVNVRCPNTPEMRRKFQPDHIRTERAISVDRKPLKTSEVQSRYLLNVSKKALNQSLGKNAGGLGGGEINKNVPKVVMNSTMPTKNSVNCGVLNKQVFSRTDSGRFSMRTSKPPVAGVPKSGKKEGKKSSGRSNSSLSSREKEFQNWKRRKSYDPMKAAAEGKRKEMAKKQTTNNMTQSYTEANYHQNQDCDSSPSHSSSVHRSQSFHGTAALEHQLISSEEEEDLTLSADEGFSPPTPSPCELSPARASLRNNAWRGHHVLH